MSGNIGISINFFISLAITTVVTKIWASSCALYGEQNRAKLISSLKITYENNDHIFILLLFLSLQ